ncbi:MAG: CinA family protein [Anaerolineae bacterium]|jgi:PncC family amidohydrolase|nr:CinA family protein [Anaerolineae bacterium]
MTGEKKQNMLFRAVAGFLGFAILGLFAAYLSACDSTSSAYTLECYQQAQCGRGDVCNSGFCTEANYDLYSYEGEINEAAEEFLQNLKERHLNVATAESLTSGMIVSSLVNVPFYGAYVYGGFATYDSDAKRVFLGVRVGNVYTRECALEMAAGTLVHSRALVSVAVTGEAGPVPKEDLTSLGVVDVAISIRTEKPLGDSAIPEDPEFPQTYTTLYKRINVCEEDGREQTRNLCEKYKVEATEDEQGFVSPGVLSLTRKLIRQDTVLNALVLGTRHLKTYTCKDVDGQVVCPSLMGLCREPYDGDYEDYGEPSKVIKEHLVECL